MFAINTFIFQFNFSRDYVKQLIATVPATPGERTTSGRRSQAVEDCRRLQARHFPSHVKSTNDKRKNATRRCVVCMPAERELRAEAGNYRVCK